MGSLSLSRSGPCGKEDLPDAPAFNEILTIVGPARRGDFAGPVDASEPRLVPIRLERLATSSRAGYLITTDRRGDGSITMEGATVRRGALPPADRDTVRLLIPELTSGPITPCQSTEYYRVRIEGATPVSASDCGFRRRYPGVPGAGQGPGDRIRGVLTRTSRTELVEAGDGPSRSSGRMTLRQPQGTFSREPEGP